MANLWLKTVIYAAAMTLLPINVCFAEGASQSLTQEEAYKNLYEVAARMALTMRQKLETLKPGSTEYNKLEQRLHVVEENRDNLGRKVPGAAEYNRESNQQTATNGQDDFRQRETNLKNIWESAFDTADRSFGSFYMFKFNDLNQVEAASRVNSTDPRLRQIAIFETTERIQMNKRRGVAFSIEEIRQIARIVRNRAGYGFGNYRFGSQYMIPLAERSFIAYMAGDMNDTKARLSWVNAYVLGLNPLNVPSDFEVIRPVVITFINELANDAGSSSSIQKSLINLYLSTRAARGSDDYAHWAAVIEKLYMKYVGKAAQLSLGQSCSNKLTVRGDDSVEVVKPSLLQSIRGLLRAN